MDLRDSEEHRRFRAEVKDFLARHAGEIGSDAFWAEAVTRGYIYRDIPKKYGGSEQAKDILKERIIGQEFGSARVGQLPCEARGTMITHTLLDHGSEAQCERFLPPTLRGEIFWCQGYSEPGSGSDLASLRSTARLEGDHFVLNGQKVWTSGAAESDWMFGLFRSEPDAKKNHGISYLLVDMTSPGIRVAPMKQMDGGMDFNEVFFDDVRVPVENLVGKRGQGWQVSRATLKYERGIIGGASMLRGRLAALVSLAKRVRMNGRPAIEDASIRRGIAEIDERIEAADLTGLRMLSAEATGNVASTIPAMLGAKLYATVTMERIADLALELLGDDLMISPTFEDAHYGGDPDSASYCVEMIFNVYPTSIGGGTSNIQRNIVGENVLGLPRDPRHDAKRQALADER